MLRGLEPIRAKHPLHLSPEHSALLILDMQRYFLEDTSHAYIPSARAIVPGIAKLAHHYSLRDLPVIYTRHVNSETDAGMMSVWWHELIESSSAKSEIIPQFDQSRGLVLEKSQYDAFHETRLEELLREKGISQLVICGVMTHLCCETTARSAFVRGFEIFFTIDGTASYNEEFHTAAIMNLAHGFAVPVLIDEIIAGLGEHDAD